ncbi:MAG: hypothetical protein M5U31_04390 [Acidimicrobiia bacterium]|nr:hypothetical protein [Acidimicrobiia bacterium]
MSTTFRRGLGIGAGAGLVLALALALALAFIPTGGAQEGDSGETAASPPSRPSPTIRRDPERV